MSGRIKRVQAKLYEWTGPVVAPRANTASNAMDLIPASNPGAPVADAVAAVREVIGYDVDLMLECYMGWTLEYAKRIIPKLEGFEPRWIEEPVIPDDIDGYAELNAMGSIPVSGGEHEFTHFGFRQLLEKRAVSVIQYDTNRVGGITAAAKVNALAEAFQVPVVPHAGHIQLSDTTPGLGVSVSAKNLDSFRIVE